MSPDARAAIDFAEHQAMSTLTPARVGPTPDTKEAALLPSRSGVASP